MSQRLFTFFLLALAAALRAAAQDPSAAAKSRDLLERGVALMQQGKPEAAGLLQEAAALDPENALPWYYLGTTQLGLESYSDAEASLAKALRLDEAKPTLGRKMRREATDSLGLAFAHQKEYAKSKEVYRAGLARDPEAPSLWYNLACVCALSGDRDGALSSLREALLRDAQLPVPVLPDPTSDQDFKGLYGDPSFFAVLLTNVGPQPNDRPGDALAREGARLLAAGDAAGAAAKLNAALEKDAENARAWFLLGGALEEQKEPRGAAAAFSKALSFRAPLAPALVHQMVRHAATRLGEQKLEEKAYDEALAALKTASEADPFHPWPFYLTARACAGLGQREKALEAIRKAYGLRDALTSLDTPLPDPLKDAAFAPWAQDPSWQSAVSQAVQ